MPRRGGRSSATPESFISLLLGFAVRHADVPQQMGVQIRQGGARTIAAQQIRLRSQTDPGERCGGPRCCGIADLWLAPATRSGSHEMVNHERSGHRHHPADGLMGAAVTVDKNPAYPRAATEMKRTWRAVALLSAAAFIRDGAERQPASDRVDKSGRF
jgi:hypothetical protein